MLQRPADLAWSCLIECPDRRRAAIVGIRFDCDTDPNRIRARIAWPLSRVVEPAVPSQPHYDRYASHPRPLRLRGSGPVALANLRDDVRVEQEFHRSTLRQSPLAWLIKDASECLIWKFRAEDVEGGLDLWMDQLVSTFGR